MADAPKQAFQVIDMDELFKRLQPTLDAIKEIVKPLDAPDSFLVYPLLTAQALFEMADGDLEIAQSNHEHMDSMTLLAFMTLRYHARQKDGSNVIPLNKGMH